jgi:GNAT superfamily N-acetyltransferase
VKRHLAQLNIATLRYPIDDPRITDFVDALPMVNGTGEQSPGYVWRLQSEGGDATDIQVFDDPLAIVNLTVWESMEALKAFAYRGVHRDFFRRRAEWFVEGASRTALWWIPAGSLPTTDHAKQRLQFMEMFGSSPYAFAMGQSCPALVIERVGIDDARAQELSHHLDDDIPSAEQGCFVVAEIDDVPAACGTYRRVDDATAEIKRMYVAQSARGMRVGAAIIAELETAARSEGLRRLVLETWPRQLPGLEQFGFHRSSSSQQLTEATGSIRLEKALLAEPSRLA